MSFSVVLQFYVCTWIPQIPHRWTGYQVWNREVPQYTLYCIYLHMYMYTCIMRTHHTLATHARRASSVSDLSISTTLVFPAGNFNWMRHTLQCTKSLMIMNHYITLPKYNCHISNKSIKHASVLYNQKFLKQKNSTILSLNGILLCKRNLVTFALDY